MRSVPSVEVNCRVSGEPLTLSFHLFRFASVWPLFLTEARNAAERRRMSAALGQISTSGPLPPSLE